ncbi:MAG: hypothetical protein P0Y53_18375 [Candidatus Pseudobacter hemicellulosilyticus]|uniref:YXWGXW repeat-containing protein n=1 Tax=Candidatus Pseudobacter hemicellulosilyticus TaxID=3121375 RepID=A0AAJ5WRM0_9BACT|nr:MAG: hypothetical protein P0Y53_18375 [Pseudobacter sp.]
MNASSITQAVAAIALTAALMSCSTASNAYSYPTEREAVVVRPQPPRYPLIIVNLPVISIHRYHDGRYYYRNPDGCYYWRGGDGRYYLEDRYVRRGHYDDRHYRDWKYKGRKRGHQDRHDRHDHHDNGRGRGHRH